MDHKIQRLETQIRSIRVVQREKENLFEELLQKNRLQRITAARDSRQRRQGGEKPLKEGAWLKYHVEHLVHFDEAELKLMEIYEEKKADIERRYLEDMLKIEMDLDNSITKLIKQMAEIISQEIYVICLYLHHILSFPRRVKTFFRRLHPMKFYFSDNRHHAV